MFNRPFAKRFRHLRRSQRRRGAARRLRFEPLEDRTLLAVFTVSTTADTNDINPGDGMAVDAAGNTSLRAAIEEANALPGADDIKFNIAGAGPHTIQPASDLPTITDPVTIDGTTQPGYAGTPVIELDGSSAGAGANGLRITAGNSTVKGLAINRFGEAGILIQIGGGNLIALNHIGTDSSGTVALANGSGVMVFDSANNLIGDPFLVGAGSNVISGNTSNNVFFSGAATTGNRVQSNVIGLDITGTAALGGNFGVTFVNGATGNTVGGTHPLQRNDISGNSRGVGIGSDAPGNIVQGNFIGLDSGGTLGVGNTVNGVVVGSSGNTIAGNVIAASPNAGVVLSGAGATGNLVHGNNIGANAAGADPLPNGFGVLIEFGAANNLIGGVYPGDGNLIAFNNLDGVRVSGEASDGNAVLGNSIHTNGGLGIDLAGDGVTANDVGDGDTGPNDLQNFPVLFFVQPGASTHVIGTLNSLPHTAFRVEVFASAAADPSGHGEGQRFLGALNVFTNAAGNAFFSEFLPGSSVVGEFITATATRLVDGRGVAPRETSEFSGAIAATPGMVAVFNSASGVLEVFGTDNADALQLSVADGRIVLQDVSDPCHSVPVPIIPPSSVPPADEIAQIIVSLRAGDDTLDAQVESSAGQSQFDLVVLAGAGRDAISIDVSVLHDMDTRIHVDTGADDDSLRFRYDSLGRLVGGELDRDGAEPPMIPHLITTIDLGGGANVADIDVRSIDPDIVFEMDTGPGDDLIQADFVLPGGPLDVIGSEDDIITGVTSMGVPGLVQVFDGASAAKLQEFHSFSGGFIGLPVAAGDVNGDGVDDIIRGAARVHTGPLPSSIPGATEVKVFDGHTGLVLHAFDAFDPFATDGVFVAAGDVNGDGFEDIIAGAGTGSPLVKVFDGVTTNELFSFLALDPSFSGGVRVAAGDVNGDGSDEIIVGAGPGAAPEVKVFDPLNLSVLNSFLAYDPSFTGGVFVAAGDVTGDGVDEIVTGPGAAPAAMGPLVKVFEGVTGATVRSFLAFDDVTRGDVRVAVGNINGDGFDDIITGSGRGVEPQVRVFDGADGSLIHDFCPAECNLPFPHILQPEVFVAAGNVNSQRRLQTIDFAVADGNDHLAVSVQAANGVDFIADLGAGNDRLDLNIFGFNPQPEPPRTLLNVDGGDGADTINVLAKMGQVSGVQPEPFIPELNVLGGQGADRITVGIEPVAGVEPTPFRLLVDGGDGADEIGVLAKIGQVSGIDPEPFIPELNVLGGQGADRITVGIEPVAGVDPDPFRLFVDGGDDADVIAVSAGMGQVSGVDPEPFIPELNVLGGKGADRITVGIEPVAGVDPQPFRLFVDAGEGDNVIDLNVVGGNTPDDGRPAEFRPAEFHIFSGAGADSFHASLTALTADISIDADLGDGDNLIDVHMARFDSPYESSPILAFAVLDLRTGDGADVVRADLRDLSTNVLFNASTGEGNDVIDLDIATGVTPDDGKAAEFNVFAGEGDNVIDLSVSGGVTPADNQPASFSVFAEGGADVLNASLTDLVADFSLNADLGAGNNVFILNTLGTIPLPEPPSRVVNLIAGEDNDTIGVNIFSVLDPALPLIDSDRANCRPVEFNVFAGAGDNVIDLNVVGGTTPDDCSPTDFTVRSGSGRDVLRASLTDLLADVSIDADLGDGGNVIDLNVGDSASPYESALVLAFDLRTGGGADLVTADFGGLSDTVLDFQAMLGDGPDTLLKTLTGIRGGGGAADIAVFGEGGDDLLIVNYGYFDGGYGVLESPLSVLVDGGRGSDRITQQFAHVRTRAPLNVVAVGGSGDDEITAVYEHVHFQAPHSASLFGDHQGDAGEDMAGDDELKLLYRDVHFTADAPLVNALAGGAGDDELTYVLNALAEALNLTLLIDAGAGNDEVKALLDIATDALMADIAILLGAGDDEAVFRLLLSAMTAAAPPIIYLNVEIHGDAGNDSIKARVVLPPKTRGNLTVGVHGDDGDDELELAVFGAEAIDELFLLLDGGNGFDMGRATANVEVLDVEEFTLIK